ncbi:MAG: type I-E CRISPR-associated protein Cse1/CasA [Syntrophomonadaceae bacterium]|nr:type I-E CRISPR-associated protein Cse1/CasA [Syntrophomonadaceae bacterium]
MTKEEFNLLYEPWILVMKPDGNTEEVSLLELFQYAPKWRGLAGELPTQDVAVLRLLLAILHASFGRYDLDGNYDPPTSPVAALKRWKAIWERGEFPMGIIKDYLLHFEDRFWLFHPAHPFYQVADMDKATDYTAAKLNGELSESGNKTRLFPQRTGEAKARLRHSEAARWLLYVNAFDDTSAKPKEKGLPSPGAGWLGRLGLIIAVGDNLFQTLLLNLVFLKNGEDELWGEEMPIWEQPIRTGERTKITMPDNPSGLLSMQSRRLLLKREEDSVFGFALLGGDFFAKENAFTEQMTVWRNAAKKETDPQEYHPKRHDPARQIWRDFPALVAQGEGMRRSGVVNWLARLIRDNLILRSHYCFQIAAVRYGDKDFFIDDVFSDSISFNAGLLTEMRTDWINRIIDELETTEKLAQKAGHLAQNLAKAAGNGKDGKAQKVAAIEQAYFRLDMPFRRWLEEIVPERDGMDTVCDQWWEQARSIVRGLGKEIVEQAGPQAFAGRTIKENKKEQRYTAPEAFNQFLYYTSTRDALKGGR